MRTFIVRSDNTGEEGMEIEAFDHESAAEHYAEWSDIQGDYSIVGGHPENISVEDPDGSTKSFRVYGQVYHRYSATELS